MENNDRLNKIYSAISSSGFDDYIINEMLNEITDIAYHNQLIQEEDDTNE